MLHWCIRHLLNCYLVYSICLSRFRLLKTFKCTDIQTLRVMGDKTTPSAQLSINALAGLNSLLNDFYSNHAQVDTIGRWFRLHAFDKALPDHAKAAWIDIQHKTQDHIADKVVADNIKDVSYQMYIVRRNGACNSLQGKKKGQDTLHLQSPVIRHLLLYLQDLF